MSNLYDFIETGEWEGVFKNVSCTRALSPSGIPGLDFVLNPYGGCNHGCVYCYAPEVTHQPWDTWRVVRVRENMPARLARELKNITERTSMMIPVRMTPTMTAKTVFQNFISRFC